MKKVAMMMAVLVIAFAISQGVALAETVSGKVVAVDVLTQTLSVSEKDAVTGVEKKVEVKVKPETTFKGVMTLAEVKEGATITVEASKDAVTGALNATSVEVKGEAKSEMPAVTPEAAMPKAE